MNTGPTASPSPVTRRRIAMWSAIAALLAVPLVAMQFTREVAWTGFDFAFAALLLVGGGLAWEGAQWASTARARIAAGGAVLAVVLLVWADGAVGVF